MSQSIHNTNVERIKLEVNSMLELLNTDVCKSESILKKNIIAYLKHHLHYLILF